MDDDRTVHRSDAPLSEAQRSFADEHHSLLLSFMAKYQLDADCYDRLALSTPPTDAFRQTYLL